jgi:hypothetical protein
LILAAPRLFTYSPLSPTRKESNISTPKECVTIEHDKGLAVKIAFALNLVFAAGCF